MFFTITGSALLGVITTILGYGWIKDGQFNPGGAFLNIIGVLFLVSIKYYFIDKKKSD